MNRSIARLFLFAGLLAFGPAAFAQMNQPADPMGTMGPALHVFDQTLANATVVIDATTLTQDGFVVVHAFDANGELVLTPPLGVVHLSAGLHRYVSVPLDQSLLKSYGYDEAGAKNVLPMVHVDANGNGSYEFPDGPDVPVMVDGAMVTATISLYDAEAVTPSVDVMGAIDLAVGADGLSVTIPAVTLAQPGFVVLHSVDASGQLVVTPVIGSSEYLTAGEHENVTIRLDGSEVPAVGDTVYAMLHTDDGDGTYTFPMSDPPVTNAAGIVMQSFVLH